MAAGNLYLFFFRCRSSSFCMRHLHFSRLTERYHTSTVFQLRHFHWRFAFHWERQITEATRVSVNVGATASDHDREQVWLMKPQLETSSSGSTNSPLNRRGSSRLRSPRSTPRTPARRAPIWPSPILRANGDKKTTTHRSPFRFPLNHLQRSLNAKIGRIESA